MLAVGAGAPVLLALLAAPWLALLTGGAVARAERPGLVRLAAIALVVQALTAALLWPDYPRLSDGWTPRPPPAADGADLMPDRLLLILLGAIGDVVCGMPLAQRLRAGWPRTRIMWAVEPAAAPLLEQHPAVDDVIIFRRRGGLPALIDMFRARCATAAATSCSTSSAI